MTDIIQWLLIAACIIIVALPTSLDPAIRLKEWIIERRRKK
jgi:hypothetical protein